MYYIVNEANNHIVESQDKRPTQTELEEIATYMQCDVYVIRGEHAGMTATPIYNADENNLLLHDDHPAFSINLVF